MKTVAFYQPFMNERGTCVAMFDYAHFNQEILGNKSVFIYDSCDARNEKLGLERIKDNFETFDIKCSNYTSQNNHDRVLKLNRAIVSGGVSHIYMCKSGYNDSVIPTMAKVLIHVVGMVDPAHAHGDVWAYVSEFSNQACAGGSMPVVPYMVNLPDIDAALRDTLGISRDAVVVGRTGGMDTFDIPWAATVVNRVIRERPDIVFIFMNTPKFMDHPRAIFLDRTVCPVKKVEFINTCDVMLHARWVGETFGAAVAEFSSKNKPVMTAGDSPERNHINILGDKGLYYNSADTLFSLLMQFKPQAGDWNCYKEFTPEKVMQIFDKVYLG
jgi:hypothetical protein